MDREIIRSDKGRIKTKDITLGCLGVALEWQEGLSPDSKDSELLGL